MASKTISVKAETYHRLARAKAEDESFSDVIDRLLGTDPHPLFDLVGSLDDDQAEALRQRSAAFRADVEDRIGLDE